MSTISYMEYMPGLGIRVWGLGYRVSTKIKGTIFGVLQAIHKV